MFVERRYFRETAERQLGYCQSVRAGDLVYLSGAVSWDENFQPLHVGDMAGQIDQVYANLSAALSGFELTFDNVVKENGYVTDMDAAAANLGARAKYYASGLLPASTWVGVTRLFHPDLMVEVELIASLKK